MPTTDKKPSCSEQERLWIESAMLQNVPLPTSWGDEEHYADLGAETWSGMRVISEAVHHSSPEEDELQVVKRALAKEIERFPDRAKLLHDEAWTAAALNSVKAVFYYRLTGGEPNG